MVKKFFFLLLLLYNKKNYLRKIERNWQHSIQFVFFFWLHSYFCCCMYGWMDACSFLLCTILLRSNDQNDFSMLMMMAIDQPTSWPSSWKMKKKTNLALYTAASQPASQPCIYIVFFCSSEPDTERFFSIFCTKYHVRCNYFFLIILFRLVFWMQEFKYLGIIYIHHDSDY